MPRGRKPKPTHLKLLRGNPGERPIRDEPQPRPLLPDPPEILNADGRLEWLRIIDEVYNLGLLTIVDVPSLTAYCQIYGRWVVAERTLAKMAALDPQTHALMIKSANGTAIPNPIVWVAANAARDMVKYAAEFGFTPAARTRIAAGYRPQESKFEGLLGKTG